MLTHASKLDRIKTLHAELSRIADISAALATYRGNHNHFLNYDDELSLDTALHNLAQRLRAYDLYIVLQISAV